MNDKVTDKRPQFFMVEDAVVSSYELDPYSGWLYIVILKHADRRTGEAFPSITRLTELSKMSRAQVMRSIAILEEKKLIRVERDPIPLEGEKRQRKPNHYFILPATDNPQVVSGRDYPSISQQLGVVSGVDCNHNPIEPESTNHIPPNPRKRGSGSSKVSPRDKAISAFTSNPIAVQLNTTFGNDIPAANMTVERMNKFTYAANDLLAIGYTPELITPALKVMAKKAEGWSHGYGLDAFLRYAPEILQGLKQPKQPRQVQPDNTPFIPILYQAKIERGEMTREEVLSIMGSAS